MGQDAVGPGVVVADHAVGQLVHEVVEIEAERPAIDHRVVQQRRALVVGVVVEKPSQTLGDALMGRHPTEVHLGPDTAGLAEGEPAQ